MPLYAALFRVRNVKRRAGAKLASVMVDGSGPPPIHPIISGKSFAKRLSVASTVQLSKNPAPEPASDLCADAIVFRFVPKSRQNCCQGCKLGMVRQVTGSIKAQRVQEFGSPIERFGQRCGPLLVILKGQPQDFLAFATDAWSIVRLNLLLQSLQPAISGSQQGNALKEFRTLQRSKNFALAKTLLARGPIVAQVILVSRESRGQQLEHIQGDAASINFLENLANGFLRRFLSENDQGNHVLLKALDDFLGQVVPANKAFLDAGRVGLKIFHLPVCQSSHVED